MGRATGTRSGVPESPVAYAVRASERAAGRLLLRRAP